MLRTSASKLGAELIYAIGQDTLPTSSGRAGFIPEGFQTKLDPRLRLHLSDVLDTGAVYRCISHVWAKNSG